MIRVFFGVLMTLWLVFFSCFSTAGIIIGGTRIIYSSDKSDATISVRNNDNTLPYLIQTWVDPFESRDRSSPPFTVIPPVSRLEPQQEKILRIMKVKGALPDDRESVFWLNVKNIPPSGNSPNRLEIAIKTRIKLFWRPAALKVTPEAAAPKVTWHTEGGFLVVHNPSAIHVNVMNVTVDGKDVPLNIIRPFETLRLPLPAGTSGHSMVWRYVNDYGGISNAIALTL